MSNNNNNEQDLNQLSDDFKIMSGSAPSVNAAGSTNESYSSADGTVIYLQFTDNDSSGLFPSTGTQLRFTVTKTVGGVSTNVTPDSTFIDTNTPKTLQLRLSQANKLIDGLYNGSGIVTSYQDVTITYSASTAGGFGTIPLLSDNDTIQSTVSSFSGIAISNRTVEANGPVLLSAYTSTDGRKVYSSYREATPPLLPTSGIGGFAITQGSTNISITNSYVLDPTSVTDGKIVVHELSTPLDISDGSNTIYISYTTPALTSTRLRDSTAVGSTADSFFAQTVTNNVAEVDPPRVVDAYTNTYGVPTIYVKMSEPTSPGLGVTGFTVYVNGISAIPGVSAAGNSTYSGNGVTEYSLRTSFTRNDSVEVLYTKPTLNYITDQSTNSNPLVSFSNRYRVRNIWFSISSLLPVSLLFNLYLLTSSYVDENGQDIYLFLQMPFGVKVNPTNLNGIYVIVDGQFSKVKTAVAQDDPTLGQIKITLYNKVYFGSNVEIAYYEGNVIGAGPAGNIGFSNSTANVEILNNSAQDRAGLFDVLSWYDDTENTLSFDFAIDENASELFRKSLFGNNSSVVYDVTPPEGMVILNKSGNQNEPGIRVHKFDAYGSQIDEEGTIVDFNIASLAAGWNISFSESKTITKLNVKMKYVNEILNTSDYVRFDIYDNSASNTPGNLLTNFAILKFSDIKTSYSEIELTPLLSYTLEANTVYWIVASCDSIVPQNISFTPEVYIATHTSTGNNFANTSTETTSGWLITEDKSIYYKLFSNNDTDTALVSSDYALDIYERPIREVSFYGTKTALQRYEVLGDNQSNYFWKRLHKVFEDRSNSANDVYPTVSKIEIGASSAKPKNYIVEIRTSPSSAWVQLFDTLTDETTLDNLVYNFTTPIEISDIRLVYKGDYFTIDSIGDLTLAAYDKSSAVTKAQISHFSDFRDVNSFANTDENGFLSFNEGTTEFLNWDISNNAAFFKPYTGISSSEILSSVVQNAKIVLAANNKVFTYYNGETSTISIDQLVNDNIQITCSAIYKNKVYVGTSDGHLYASLTGDYWTVVNALDPLDRTQYKTIKPILSMAVYGDKLLIGTSKGTSSNASLYTYDGKIIDKIKDFDATYEYANCITTANFIAYVGLGGIYGSANSAVYTFNNIDWTLSLASTADNVEAISYSTAKNSIVTVFRGGDVWELPFVSNIAGSWSKIYDTNCDHTFAISDDPNGDYLFISGDIKTVMYVKSLNSFKVVSSYKSESQGLNINWKKYATYAESYSADIADIENYTSQYYGVIDNLNYSNFTQSGFGTSSRSVVEGYIKADADGEYRFRLVSNMGTKLSVGGIAITSNYSSIGITTDQTLQTTRTFTMSKNDLLQFKIESFVSTSTTPSMKLYWQNVVDIDGFQIIPSTQLYRKSQIKSILPISSSYYGIGADGKVYGFNASLYATKKREVYVRLKDEAGNIHGLVLSGKTTSVDPLYDKITQDLNTIDNTYQTRGKIYQIQRNTDETLETRVAFTPNSRQYSIYSPDRKVRETGYYEAEPFFVPTLVKWGKLTNLIINRYALNTVNGQTISGLDAGTAIKAYVRAGSTRSDCLNATWSSAYEVSFINNNSAILPVETQEINIENYNGKWFQYKYELISATKNLTPEVVSTTITYVAGTASYYFTKIFDTTNYDSSAPVIRRGILTSNELLNNGTITYGYINSSDTDDIYDFNKYKEITPNKVFEIDNPSSKIKFGILFTSVGTTPSVVYDFAVQLDIGDSNIKFMPSL